MNFEASHTPRRAFTSPDSTILLVYWSRQRNLHSTKKATLSRYPASVLSSLRQYWARLFLLILWSSASDVAVCSLYGKRPNSFRKKFEIVACTTLASPLQNALTFMDYGRVALVFYFSFAYLFVGFHFLLCAYEFLSVGSLFAVAWF